MIMNIKNIVKQFVIVLMLLMSIGIFAQTTKSAGTRITDEMTESSLNNAAILDLDSTTKGFFLPRMNTAQRGQLEAKVKASGKSNTGLAIYNTDIDCVEYWNARATKWMSLCGSLPPAKLDIDGDCNGISITGLSVAGTPAPSWQQGTPLVPDSHFVTIRVKVEQIGTYSVSANTDNGYFFSAEGQFQAPGYYNIVLKGMGTPINGYDQTGTGKKGDKLVFSFNGIESTVCTTKEIAIIPADLKLKIVAGTYKAAGKYYVNEPASGIASNSLEITVNVETRGTATITATNTNLGIKFSETKTLEVGNGQKIVLKPVAGEATPKDNKDASYDLTFGVNVSNQTDAINGNKATIVIEPTEISVDKTKVTLGIEPFYQGTALNDKHQIIVPVKVIGSGKSTLRLKDAVNGIEFEAKDVELNRVADPNAVQNVTFVAVAPYKTLPEKESITLTLSGDAPRFAPIQGDKTIDLKLEKKPVAYTIKCTEIKSNKTATAFNKPVGKDYYINVPVNVTVAGEYEIYTIGDVDGISFSSNVDGKKQVFPGTGPYTVKLYAVNGNVVPTNKGEYPVVIATRDGSNNANCANKFIAKVGYNDIKALLYVPETTGTYGYQLNIEAFLTKGTAPAKNFGPDGVLALTGEVTYEKMIYIGDSKAEPTNADKDALADRINANNYNFIIIDGITAIQSFTPKFADAIYNYITKGGAIIITASNGGRGGFKPGLPGFLAGLSYTDSSYWPIASKNNNGVNMLIKLNNNTDMLYTSYTKNARVIDITEPLFNTPQLTLSTDNLDFNNSNPLGGARTTGSKFTALAGLEKNVDGAVLMRHKDYPYFIFMPMIGENGSRQLFEFTASGAGMKFISYYPQLNGVVIPNIFVNLIKKVAND